MNTTRSITSGLRAFALAAFVSAALACAAPATAAHADAGGSAGQAASAYAPSAVYANSLFSDKAAEVQHVEAAAGGKVVLSGDFLGGWGAVTFTWSAAEASSAGSAGGQASGDSLGTAPRGVFGDDEDALSSQEVDAGAYGWRQLGSTTLPGQLPSLNKAVVPGGTSQTLELSDLQEGSYALCLTATDEAGDESSIYWDVSVQTGEGETMKADTSVHLLINPTQADIGGSGATVNADAVGASAADRSPRGASWRMPSKRDGAAVGDDSTIPKMGDALGAAPAVLGVALAVAGAALGAMAAARVLRRRKAGR